MNEHDKKFIEDLLYQDYSEGFDSGRRQLIEQLNNLGFVSDKVVDLLKMLFVEYDPKKAEKLCYPNSAEYANREDFINILMEQTERRLTHE